MKASIITYVIGLLFTLIGLGASFYTDKSQQTIILAATLPVITLLVADRISNLFKQHEDSLALKNHIDRRIPQVSAIHIFKDSAEAMIYLNQNIKNAISVENTRVVNENIEKENVKNDKVTIKFDDIIKNRIKLGLDYKWVVSHHYQEYAKSMLKTFNDDSLKNNQIGSFTCFMIDQGINPTFNFVILHYYDTKEVIFGWSILEEQDYSEKVLLFRDARVVDYFVNIFRQYVSVSRPIKIR